MSELEKIVKNVLLGGVGAVATAVEKTGELARSLVNKGAETVRSEKADALARKGKDVLNGIGERFNALVEQIGKSVTRREAPAGEASDELESELNELDSLETELEEVEAQLREEPKAEPEAASAAADAEAKVEEVAEKACAEAEKVMDSLADKAEAFLNSGKLEQTANRLADEGGKLFRKVEEAIDSALSRKPENPGTAEATEEKTVPDTESILQTLSQRLEDFAKRLDASRKAIEDKGQKKDE